MSDTKSQISVSRRTVFRATVVAMAGGLAMQARTPKDDPALLRNHDHTDVHGANADRATVDSPDACKVVEGGLAPEGWCAAFAPKA
jgi:hypothetical protein